MEALFNVVWVLVAVAAIGAWCLHPARTVTTRERATQMIALTLLIVVLFPVISLTDDFQSNTAWAESESTARRILVAHHPATIATTAVAMLTISQLAPRIVAVQADIVPAPHETFRLPLWLSSAGNRPPPLV